MVVSDCAFECDKISVGSSFRVDYRDKKLEMRATSSLSAADY